MALMRMATFLAAPLLSAGPVAANCLPPERPYLPSQTADARTYADLIRSDFEDYIAAIQEHFRCLDAERARAFTEAQEVSQDYGRFVAMIED